MGLITADCHISGPSSPRGVEGEGRQPPVAVGETLRHAGHSVQRRDTTSPPVTVGVQAGHTWVMTLDSYGSRGGEESSC